MQVYRNFSFPVLVTRKKKSFLSTLPNFRLSQERVAMPNHVISHVDQSSTSVTMIPTRWGFHWIMGWHAPTLEITLVRVLLVWVDLNTLLFFLRESKQQNITLGAKFKISFKSSTFLLGSTSTWKSTLCKEGFLVTRYDSCCRWLWHHWWKAARAKEHLKSGQRVDFWVVSRVSFLPLCHNGFRQSLAFTLSHLCKKLILPSSTHIDKRGRFVEKVCATGV